MTEVGSDPLVWRIPPAHAALMILVACPCAAVNIYGHPSAALRLVTVVVGVVALLVALVSLRMYLAVDDEGIAVRFLHREQWLPWSSVDHIEVVSGVRGSDTIRFSRADRTFVDVPPSLLQPTRPVRRPAAGHLLRDAARRIEARRPTA
ncbi:hypothetical protein [Streptomyces sp. NPDC059466]|uniref:hypothetical protein n=1 Tax=unclassified Streptomyces TaxID=2593676 RepID=UPI0036AA7E98